MAKPTSGRSESISLSLHESYSQRCLTDDVVRCGPLWKQVITVSCYKPSVNES